MQGRGRHINTDAILEALRFHNYCFEIQLSDEITYTYRITEGVARNQNATYLLKNILKEQEI
jgi:hypothetical protein